MSLSKQSESENVETNLQVQELHFGDQVNKLICPFRMVITGRFLKL